MLNPFRLFVTVNVPFAATDALIQWPLHSALSSKFAIMSSAVLCSLAMSNSELIINHSRTLAGELSKQAGPDDHKFISLAFLQILSRPPTEEEFSLCLRALAAHPTTRPTDTIRPRQNLVLVLFNHNDFVTIR